MVDLIIFRPKSDRFWIHPTEIRPFLDSSDRNPTEIRPFLIHLTENRPFLGCIRPTIRRQQHPEVPSRFSGSIVLMTSD
jgi:hypothetical protein